jgi:hypothetical protein
VIRDTHLTLDQVAERFTALGWKVRPDISPYNHPQLIVTLPTVFGLARGFFVFTELPKTVQWRSVCFGEGEDVKLIQALEAKEVTA